MLDKIPPIHVTGVLVLGYDTPPCVVGELAVASDKPPCVIGVLAVVSDTPPCDIGVMVDTPIALPVLVANVESSWVGTELLKYKIV